MSVLSLGLRDLLGVRIATSPSPALAKQPAFPPPAKASCSAFPPAKAREARKRSYLLGVGERVVAPPGEREGQSVKKKNKGIARKGGGRKARVGNIL